MRKRLCATLAAGGHKIFARRASVDELIDSCDGEMPACIVIGFARLDQSAGAAVRELRSRLSEVSPVLVFERANNGDVRRALELGVGGVVLNNELGETLAAVVAVVSAGQVSVPGSQRSELQARVLTTREKQILGLVTMGMTNAQIANKLFLAESTVKSHLSSAFAKLDVSSRNEAVSVILDPERGAGLGILSIPAEPVSSRSQRRPARLTS